MREMGGFEIVHRDTRLTLNGIAGSMENTADPAEVVQNETTGFFTVNEGAGTTTVSKLCSVDLLLIGWPRVPPKL